MHPWFAQYLHKRLEDFLPDPYDEICAKLESGEPFAYSRFGDGELAAVFDVAGANSDGQKFHPELGRRLREIVESEPPYMMGLQTLAMVVHGVRPILMLAPGTRWVLADSLHNASMEGKLGRLFEALSGRDVLLAGAPHHAQLAKERSWEFFEIPYGDCWPQYEWVREGLEGRVGKGGRVVLLCASMTANVLLDDLHRASPGNTYVDAGSVFDPYVGVQSRTYHEELSSDPLQGIGIE